MKIKFMLKFISSSLLLLFSIGVLAQNQTIDLSPKDTLSTQETYGIKINIDVSKKLLELKNNDYTGFELGADFRINQWWYIAAEIGEETKTIFEDTYKYTASGSYFKIGADINNYENWYGMYSMITLGIRFAHTTHSQQLNEFDFYNSDRYWNPESFDPTNLSLAPIKGLSSSWLELVIGIKTELFSHIYLGGSVRIGMLVAHDQMLNYPNNWVPGFNNVTENSKFGANYNYTLSYLIPLFEKPRKYKKEKAYFPVEGAEAVDSNTNYRSGSQNFRK